MDGETRSIYGSKLLVNYIGENGPETHFYEVKGEFLLHQGIQK